MDDGIQDSRKRGMTTLRATLAAGAPRTWEISGDYFHCYTAPVDDLVVRFDDGEPVPFAQGTGQRRYYSRLTLESATGQTVDVRAGFGSVFDGRASVTGLTLNTQIAPGNTLNNGGDAVCGAGAATQLLAADPDRLYALVKNASTNTVTVRIGSAAVTAASGTPLEPGETLPLATTAAVYAWNPSGGAVTISAASVRDV